MCLKNENISYKIQACPQVLRHTVSDLFPSRNFEQAVLSVITLTIKPDLKLLRKNTEIETEKLAQLVIWCIMGCLPIFKSDICALVCFKCKAGVPKVAKDGLLGGFY